MNISHRKTLTLRTLGFAFTAALTVGCCVMTVATHGAYATSSQEELSLNPTNLSAELIDCPKWPTTPWATDDGGITYGAHGQCAQQGSYLAAMLFHYFAPPFPDVQVASITDHNGPDFSAYQTVCDNGGSVTYYTRAVIFLTYPIVFENSDLSEFNHC